MISLELKSVIRDHNYFQVKHWLQYKLDPTFDPDYERASANFALEGGIFYLFSGQGQHIRKRTASCICMPTWPSSFIPLGKGRRNKGCSPPFFVLHSKGRWTSSLKMQMKLTSTCPQKMEACRIVKTGRNLLGKSMQLWWLHNQSPPQNVFLSYHLDFSIILTTL